MRVPKKLKIGGMSYDIIYPYDFEEDRSYLGLHQGLNNTIKLGNMNRGIKLPNDLILETFIHEIVHGIDFQYCGICFSEEQVELIGKILLTFFSQNEIGLNNDIIPKEVTIFCHRYEVVNYTFTDTASCTQLDQLNLKILVDMDNKDYHISALKSGLFEIILRTLFDMYGIDIKKIEDFSMIPFSCGVYQVFKDNKLEEFIRKWKNEK